MEDFNTVNKYVKNSINSFLEDTSKNPIAKFNLTFFKPICIDCTREDCIIRHALYNADMIASCKYFSSIDKYSSRINY